jgi:hypothetical protein
VLTSSTVDHEFDPQLGQTKDYKMCCFSANHIILRRKSKELFDRKKDNVSEWNDMSTRGLLFQ